MSSSTDVCGRACSYTLGRKTTRVNGVASRERRSPRQAGCQKEHDHDAEPLRPRAVRSSPLPGVAARGRARATPGATAPPAQSQRTTAACATAAVLACPPHEATKRIPAAHRLRKERGLFHRMRTTWTKPGRMEKTMLPILLTLIVVSTLIYGGIRVNLYLYATRVLGASLAGCPQSISALAPEPDAIAGESFSLPLAKTDNVSAR